ncbi:MAG: carbon-nitrogen hydrolase [Verrucomicrobiae bacterium]|nr:carbon-nitrogen hydrolase [Verrucomicrobiae bacterium]MDW7979815.1 carbon-nitrogen hydrolase [Verrucomicrobiales bacterium]
MTPRESSVFTLALIQTRCGPDPDANLQKTLALAERAARQGARIVCTQELFRTQYFCQLEDYRNFELAEPVPGPTTDAFSSLAKKLGVVCICSVFERRAPGLYHNTAAVIDADGALLGIYRKMHIPDDPGYFEKFYFTPGDTGFKAWQTRFGKIGVLICWDQWFPEAARLVALQGAQIIFCPTAIGWLPAERAKFGRAQHDAWETVQRAHAVANGCYWAAVNRVGLEKPAGTKTAGIHFWGQSFVAGPDGAVLAKASATREETLLVKVDLRAIERQRTHWPFLRDRRVDAYGHIAIRFAD